MANNDRFDRARYGHRDPTYLTRHWRGDLSLGRSFWLNGLVLAGVSGALCWWGMARLAAQVTDARLLLSPVLGLLLAYVALHSWSIVGTWRAARRIKRSGHGRFWPLLVQLVLLLGLPSMMWKVGLQGWMLTTAIRDGQKMQMAVADLDFVGLRPGVHLSDDGTEIEFNGPITPQSGQTFETVMAQAPNVRLVRLRSPGGQVSVARTMGHLIRRRGLDTEVDDHCESACTLVFFAGQNRIVRDGARLGFHSYHAENMPNVPLQALWAIEAEDERAFEAEGIPRWFISRIFAMPPDGIWYPTRQELITARFVTRCRPAT